MMTDTDRNRSSAEPSKSFPVQEGVALLEKVLKQSKVSHQRQRKILDEIAVKTVDQAGAALVFSCFLGYKDVALLLLKHNLVNIEQTATLRLKEKFTKPAEGATALWSASHAGHFEIVKLLVEEGADVNHTTKTLSTPLRTACFRGRLDIVQYLVEHGADTNAVNNEGSTCLMAAAYNRHDDIVRYLVTHGAQLDRTDRHGKAFLS